MNKALQFFFFQLLGCCRKDNVLLPDGSTGYMYPVRKWGNIQCYSSATRFIWWHVDMWGKNFHSLLVIYRIAIHIYASFLLMEQWPFFKIQNLGTGIHFGRRFSISANIGHFISNRIGHCLNILNKKFKEYNNN